MPEQLHFMYGSNFYESDFNITHNKEFVGNEGNHHFDPPLLPKKLWLIFIGMKQKILNQNGRPQHQSTFMKWGLKCVWVKVLCSWILFTDIKNKNSSWFLDKNWNLRPLWQFARFKSRCALLAVLVRPNHYTIRVGLKCEFQIWPMIKNKLSQNQSIAYPTARKFPVVNSWRIPLSTAKFELHFKPCKDYGSNSVFQFSFVNILQWRSCIIRCLTSKWTFWIGWQLDKYKAMKSSPLLGPFGDLKFFGFSLLKIKICWVLWCIKVQICKQCTAVH